VLIQIVDRSAKHSWRPVPVRKGRSFISLSTVGSPGKVTHRRHTLKHLSGTYENKKRTFKGCFRKFSRLL